MDLKGQFSPSIMTKPAIFPTTTHYFKFLIVYVEQNGIMKLVDRVKNIQVHGQNKIKV